MSELTDRINSVIAPAAAFDNLIEIVDSEGSWVTASDGRRYLDFACGIAVGNLGHQPPSVKHAVLEQIDRVWHAGGVFLYDTLAKAGERLQEITPAGIEKFFFMNSGAEAVEGAIKLARKTTARQGIVAFRGGFHGRTMGSVSYTTSKSKYRQGYHPLVGSVFITPFPHPFRWQMSQDEAVERCLSELHLMFKHVVTPEEVAAFLVEPLQGEGGYYPAGKEFLDELRRLSDEHGILLVMDEVQTGFGRTGEWFTSQIYDVQPDVLVMGKGIANGFPLSAFGTSAARFDEFPVGSHGSTFGGNPVSCAAAVATVDALAGVVPQVQKLSRHAFDRFGEMQEKRRTIGDVRGLGLMIGVDLVGDDGHTPAPEAYQHLKRYCFDNGMLILPCGPDVNVVRFIPPLTVSTEELDMGIDLIDAALTDYEST